MSGLFREIKATISEDKRIHFNAKGDFSYATDTGQEIKYTVIMPGRIITYTEQSAAIQSSPNQVTWDLMKFQGK